MPKKVISFGEVMMRLSPPGMRNFLRRLPLNSSTAVVKRMWLFHVPIWV